MTTKAVERTAEALGENVAAREWEEIQRAMQLDLPIVKASQGIRQGTPPFSGTTA